MKIMFVPETGHGIGHIKRCITIADEFQWDDVLFVAVQSYGVEKIGYRKIIYNAKSDAEKEERVVQAAADFKPDVCFLDLLNLGLCTGKLINLGIKVVSIYDFIAEPPKSDAVINPSPSAKLSGANMFSGMEYMPIANIYLDARLKYAVRKECKSILVSMGGSDPKNQTKTVIEALEGTSLDVNIVLGPGFEMKEELAEKATKLGFSVHESVSDEKMCELMLKSDIAITTPGNTMYEFACIGVPNIVVCNHEKHKENADRFAEEGAVINLGIMPPSQKIKNALEQLSMDYEKRKSLHKNTGHFVDGKGTERVLEIIRRLI